MFELIMLLSLVLGHYSELAIVGALLIVNAVRGFARERCAAGVMETLWRRFKVRARVLRKANWQVVFGAVTKRDVVPQGV